MTLWKSEYSAALVDVPPSKLIYRQTHDLTLKMMNGIFPFPPFIKI